MKGVYFRVVTFWIGVIMLEMCYNLVIVGAVWIWLLLCPCPIIAHMIMSFSKP